jgi:flagellar basal-body rod protein FlgC
MDLATSMIIAASGMRAQSGRMRTIAENLANSTSMATTPGGDPYRRKVATMTTEFDRALGASMVKSGQPSPDMSDFQTRYEPGNPAADKRGYVKLPNVNSLVEIMDMREAQSSYEADLNALDAAKGMMSRTVDLLRS